jgi:hypothetical protein
MAKTSAGFHRLRLPAALVGLLLPIGGQGLAVELSFPITTDTYIDSRITNTGKNYGAANTIRVVVNGSDASVTRGLFELPPEIHLYAPDQILQAVVSFYVWQDNTGARNVTLYPLTRAFKEGTGNGASPADGATWHTYDGTNSWIQPGGDYDTNFPVVATKGAVLDTNQNDRFFYWDVWPLLTNEIARSNLLTHGAILQIDETPLPPTNSTPRAPFTSSDDTSYAVSYRPQLRLLIVPRTVDVWSISREGDAVLLNATNCTPFVYHRIEYTSDLLQTNGWTLLTNVAATGTATNWSLPLPTNAPRAFYRVGVEP